MRHEDPPRSPSAAQAQKTAKSTTSSRKSLKAKKIAKLREEIAKRKLELALARAEIAELESEDDSEDTLQDAEDRVNEWLDNHPGASKQPDRPNPGEPIEKPNAPIEDSATKIKKSPQHEPKTAEVSPPPPQPNPQPAPATSNTIDITQLAAAFAMAARSAAAPVNARYVGELPYFNGSHTDWLAFRAAYLETSTQLSAAENSARIRRALKGKAREAVDSLLIANAPAEEIIKTLENRFGRPDSIAITELEKLHHLPRLTDSPRDICTFANKIKNCVATLQLLAKNQYLFNPQIIKELMEKLTPSVRYRWFDFAAERRTTEMKTDPELVLFSEFMDREADRCAQYASPEQVAPEASTAPPRRYRALATQDKKDETCEDRRNKIEDRINTENRAKTENRRFPCSVCKKEEHRPTDCPKMKTADNSDRWKIAKEANLCYRCLQYRNRTHRCKARACGKEGCERTHHPLLHFKPTRNRNTEEPEEPEKVTTACDNRELSAYLKYIPVRVTGPKGHFDTYALLDDGSTVTLVEEATAARVGAEGPQEPLNIETIDTRLSANKSRRVTLKIRGQNEEYELQARTIKKMKISPQSVEARHLWACDHLKDLEDVITYEDARPTILIGQDNWHLLIASEVRKGSRRQLVASKTPLGWVLHGSDSRTIGRRVDYVHHLVEADSVDDRMDEMLKHHFALESMDIADKKPRSDPEQRAIDILEAHTVQKRDGQYETALLWKKEDSRMPYNYENALKRLITTEKKIDKDPRLKQKYTEQMEALVKKGYAERAPTVKKTDRTWYLPHFPVINAMKPDKVRVVHDAAAKTTGTSLNDHLLTGPDLLRSLIGVLMRFRQHRFAVTADIAEMFMRIGIRPEDRDALRYLWRGDRREGPPDEYRMKSLIFGATCSPATAIFVKNLNARKHEGQHPEAAAAIVEAHYMDDYLDSFTTEQEAITVAQQVKQIHAAGNFDLRNWVSNSSHIEEALNEEVKTPQHSKQLDDGTKTERVLGLMWNPKTDELGFNLNLARIPPALLNNTAPTKREILKIIMSIYDPLGLASPVISRGKQIMQEVWRRGTGWDSKIDADLSEQWTAWLTHMKNLRDVTVPRTYINYSEATSLQLHVFVDASTTAYAAALYWRAETEDGRVSLALIVAKARVAPLKLTSVPRLELQAAVLGAKMAATVLEEHSKKPESKTFWTDSKTVLTWLNTGARSYKPFVAHRIAAIEEFTRSNEWRWVPTKLNNADDATRDVPTDFDKTHRWFTGPPFLLKPPSEWPSEKPPKIEATGEERTHHVCVKITASVSESTPDSTRFSKWERLLRTTARVLQFIELCRGRRTEIVNYRRKAQHKDPDWSKKTPTAKPVQRKQAPKIENRRFIPIEAELIRRAEELIVRAIQQDSFATEIEKLKKNEAPPTDSRLRALSTVLVNGIIRIKSRVNAAAGVSETQKSPAVLDGNHRATKLWIEYTHRSLQHAGVETTVNECRQYYWILRLRPVTRVIVRSCLPCRIRRAAPTSPSTGDLPPTRLAHHQRPFLFVGLDYFGPQSVTVGRRHEKRYVALFTCLTTRAVHLEVTASLSTDSAVMALRRMIARRGCPSEIWSDNGTNFHGADAELRKAALQATAEEANIRAISWRFIPPGAPFMGGAWERLVRSVKTALSAVLHEKSPTEEVFATLLAEAEYTVNSRPLTHVSVNIEDAEALTPNHILLGGSARVPIPGQFDDKDLMGRPHWKASQRLADQFWARWVREYLPELQHRREPRGSGPPIAVGDVVLIVDGNLPRNTWPRGVVVATHPGQDGTVRVVDVKTAGGTLRRATKRLVILTSTSTASVVSPSTEECSVATSPDTARRENVRDNRE